MSFAIQRRCDSRESLRKGAFAQQDSAESTPEFPIRSLFSALFSFESFFVLFLLAGKYKADPRFHWVPVDLTALFFALSIVSGMLVLWRRGMRVPRGSTGLVFSFLCFTGFAAASLIWTPGWVYASQKVFYIATLVLWSLVACAFIIAYDRQRLIRFFGMLVVASVWFAWESSRPLLYGGSAGRIHALGTSYLGLGQTIGLGTLVVVVYLLFGKGTLVVKAMSSVLLFMFIGILGFLGGRGPLLATLVSVSTPLFLGMLPTGDQLQVKRYSIVMLGVLIACGVLLMWLYSRFSAVGLDRLIHVFGNIDSMSRTSFYKDAVDFWLSSPLLGNGIGAWPVLRNMGDFQLYPHNMILEILVELGLVGLVLYGGTLFLALTHLGSLNSIARSPWRLLILMCFLNVFLNAMFSGDISDNREVFAMLGLMVARVDSGDGHR